MKKVAYIALVALIFASCSTEVEMPVVEKPVEWTQDESVDLIKSFVEEEEGEIQAFLTRHDDWKMTTTGTGLRYFIYQKNEEGDSAKAGMTAQIKYDISLLDGTECYTSDSLGPESFKIDKSDVESGLHQGIKLMKVGERAKLIIPSPIALGLVGDLEKIPPMMTIIYDIELVGLK